MNKILFPIVVIFSLILFSCKSDKQKRAETVTEDFLSALKTQDVEKMQQLYPSVLNIEIFFASDTSFIIDSYKLYDNGIQVSAESQYINENGAVEIRKILFFLYPDEENSNGYLVKDSFGLCSFENYPHFKFAVNTGCISPDNPLTDQQAIKQLKIAKELLYIYARLMYNNLESNIKIVSSTISSRDQYGAQGFATVVNNSEFTLPDLKYIIIYYDDNNNEVYEDTGWVTQNSFEPGQTIGFDFKTKYTPQASNASFELDFDLELILDFVKEDNIYKGTEYKEYIENQLIKI
ncbi:MAG: hypothetical protein Q4F97_01125 [Bacteroidales bacterium]|nr:hypothetical protein [Bacteroidales bacterium]